jgi:hypothetical protein
MKMTNKIFLTTAVLIAILFAACEKDTTAPSNASSFDLIQAKILTHSCATSGCHASEKDGLVLTKDLAYDRMVNVTPLNATAKNDGLKIIKPFVADKSLLFHKVHEDASHHISDYGKLMPIGGKALTTNQVEFIKRWINAGAPKTGDIVDKSLLN